MLFLLIIEACSLSLFLSLSQDHSRFVNAVRFAPNGELFCSGGSDGLAVLYNGKTSEKVAQFSWEETRLTKEEFML